MTIKAYAWNDDYIGNTYIVWTETAGKAKALAEKFLAHGWWLPCAKCGTDLYQDTAVLTDTKVLCKECAGKDGEEK